jgi:hypothetical protein
MFIGDGDALFQVRRGFLSGDTIVSEAGIVRITVDILEKNTTTKEE